MLATALLSSALSILTNATPGRSKNSSLTARSSLASVPAGFLVRNFAALPEEILQLTLGLPQVHSSGLHDTLLDISDPKSPNYGHHLSKNEVEQLVAPSPESLHAVTQWLKLNGISPVADSASVDMLRIWVPVAQANALLDANFTAYLHEATNTTMIRTLSYSLPEHLHEHITLVYPTTQFLPPVKRRLSFMGANTTLRADKGRRAIPATCAQTMTPKCLQEFYHIPTEPAAAQNNSLYVSGYGGQCASANDLQAFLTTFRPDIKNGSFDLLSVSGDAIEGQGTDEADFDIQYTVGVATGVSTTFLKGPERNHGVILQDLLDTVDFLLVQDEVPLVLTTSYLFVESDVGPEYAQMLCNAYAQLGARGTSVIFASGDSGVAGGFANDPADCNEKPFVPTFPSTCPFVTSVGATQGFLPEVAAPFSSGGFSDIFPRPSYQDDAVERYLDALGPLHAGRYNSTARAYPDVSMHGVDYLYNLNGKFVLAWGTSTSAPAFASIVALLNDRLLQRGKSPLGFLNPLLYSTGLDAFTDIKSGSNPGCGTDGFPAYDGWDPVTGLGTPDFEKLLVAVVGEDLTSRTSSRSGAGRFMPMGSAYVLGWTLTFSLLYSFGLF